MRLKTFARSAAAATTALALAAAFGGCGDLVIPGSPEGGTGGEGGAMGEGGVGGDGAMGDGAAADSSTPPLDCTSDATAGHPVHLGCTGLYVDWGASPKKISPDAVAYDPGLSLWADGARSSRYIYLPPGTKIDTTDLNEWVFPVGTKVWQELSLLGKKIETRYVQKLGPQLWFRTTYQWSDDQMTADENTGGARNLLGIGYEIPSTDHCVDCHGGRKDFLLGFELVSLASMNSSGLNLTTLKAQSLLTNVPAATPQIPRKRRQHQGFARLFALQLRHVVPQQVAGRVRGTTGLRTRLDVDATGALPSDPKLVDAWTTAVGVVSTYTPMGVTPGTFFRIKAHDVPNSAIVYRANRRDDAAQPPLATHVVDMADVKIMTDWINAMP